MTKIDGIIPDIIKNDITEIINNFSRSQFSDNIIKIILFGSFASKKYQPDSDIDIAVVLENLPARKQLADYYLLTDNIKRPVDLIFCTEEQLLSGKYVYSEILRGGIVIYEKL